MLSALELAEAGQDVVILDKGQAGLEASWAGGGIISPLSVALFPINYRVSDLVSERLS